MFYAAMRSLTPAAQKDKRYRMSYIRARQDQWFNYQLKVQSNSDSDITHSLWHLCEMLSV